jgi:uncharacterized protein YfaT (DUF1175 family)
MFSDVKTDETLPAVSFIHNIFYTEYFKTKKGINPAFMDIYRINLKKSGVGVL